MSDGGSEDRGRVAAALTWALAGTLVLAVHAVVIVALVRRPEPVVTATGGDPGIDVDLEPVEGERAPDDRPAESSGDPTTASAAADAAAAAAASTPVPPAPPPEPAKAAPVPPPPPEPESAKAAPVPSPEPAKAAPVPPPEPEPAKDEHAPAPTLQIAQASASSAAAEAAEDSAPAVQRLSAGREAAWRGKLVAHLNRFRRFPPGLGSGTTRVGFSIDATGRVTTTSIVTASGDAALDAAARDLVARASPFPPPPAGVTGKGLSFVVPVHFDGRRR